tara:strand:+ start:267 stop:653 length:387 start_codon:yes stop_codon:yes gene_type:complete
MTNSNMEALPPEMQARIADIIAKGKANQVPVAAPNPQAQRPDMIPVAPQAAVPQRPSLMDHVMALRQEVAAMRNEVATMSQQVAAAAQVTEAVGGAVGQLYGMFFEQSQAPTYSSSFEAGQPGVEDDY